MMYESYPLYWPEGWARTVRHKRKDSLYKVTFKQARDELVRGLSLLRGKDVVISTNIPTRKDGLPYANHAEPNDPGVAVYWIDRRGAPRAMACDNWKRVRENMRAVGMTIDAIRSIDRAGASELMDRAFTGFAALPASTDKAWWVVLGTQPTANVATIKQAYRYQAQRCHPDTGGTTEMMAELNAAYEQALKGPR